MERDKLLLRNENNYHRTEHLIAMKLEKLSVAGHTSQSNGFNTLDIIWYELISLNIVHIGMYIVLRV